MEMATMDEDHQHQTRKGTRWDQDVFSDYGDAVSDMSGYVKNPEEVFHDAPEIKDALHEVHGASGNPGDHENASHKKQNIPMCQSRIRRPLITLGKPHETMEERLEHLQFPNYKTNQKNQKMTTPTEKNKEEANITDKDTLSKRYIPVSRERQKQKINSLLSDFQIKPKTFSRGSFDEKTKQLSEGGMSGCSISRRRPLSCLNSLVRKKANLTLDLNESRKPPSRNLAVNEPEAPRKSDKMRSPNSKVRLEQVRSTKHRVAAARSAFLETNTVLNKDLNSNPYERLFRKKPSCDNEEIKVCKIKEEETTVYSTHESEDTINFVNEETTNKSEESNTDLYISQLRDSNGENLTSASVAIYTDLAINTDPSEANEDMEELKKENEERKLSETNLRKNNAALLATVAARKKKEEALSNEISSLSETLIKNNETLKDLNKKLKEKDSTIAQLRSNINKYQVMADSLKVKDAKMVELQNQIFSLKEDYNKVKKEFEKSTNEKQQLLKEKESMKKLVQRLTEEKDIMEKNNFEISQALIEKEAQETNTNKMLDHEKKMNAELKERQLLYEKNIADLKSQLKCKTENSSNVLGLSEQLMEKDAIICDLEKLRNGVQLLNKDVCGMIACVFQEFGNPKSENEIESLISCGRILSIKNSLISLLENHGTDKDVHEECRQVIFNLEDRSAILEAELEESKNYSETLAGVISSDKLWNDGERGLSTRVVSTIGDTLSRPQEVTECKELFVLLEGKRQALMRMERRMQELEEVHANCSQKRVRNEMRIDQLEMALAQVNFR